MKQHQEQEQSGVKVVGRRLLRGNGLLAIAREQREYALIKVVATVVVEGQKLRLLAPQESAWPIADAFGEELQITGPRHWLSGLELLGQAGGKLPAERIAELAQGFV